MTSIRRRAGHPAGILHRPLPSGSHPVSARRGSGFTHALLLAGALLGIPGQASGQVIPIKTVPVAAGDQFLLFPSANLS